MLVDRRAQIEDGIGPTFITVAPVDDSDGMPDLRGLGAREALRRLARRRLVARLQGTGLVVSQMPAPGTPVDPSSTCTLILDRSPRRVTEAIRGELP